MRIRRAKRADARAVSELWTESARAGFESLLPAGHRFPSFDREHFGGVLEDEGVGMLVIERDAQLIAHSTFGRSRDPDAGPDVGEIRSFFVRPSAWRHGVGTALMSSVLDGLLGMGFAEATLWSFADNERANAFYERRGFRRDGAEQHEEQWANLLELRYRVSCSMQLC